MNVLDENILAGQYELLQSWGFHVRQIGYDAGRQGMDDDEIISLLHRHSQVTFFTRDRDFSNRFLCHLNYCLVHLVVGETETAEFTRRVLRHPDLNTKAKRMGKVIRVTSGGLYVWQLHAEEQDILRWPTVQQKKQ